MKKLLLLISFVFCAIASFAQYPITQNLGSSKTLVNVKGGLGVDSSLVFIYNFPDTTTASLGFLDNIPGNVIRAKDTLWVRNNSATAWVKLGSGGSGSSVNIYNSNGTLTGDRALDGDGNDLFFDNINEYTLSGTGSFVSETLLRSNGLTGSIILGRFGEGKYFEARDSLRILGVGETSSDGLYSPLINPVTGALTKGDIFGQSLQQIGTRFNYAWSSNPLNTWTDNTPGMTVTTSGTVTNVAGAGAFNLNNNFALANQYFSTHNWTVEFTAVVKEKDGDSYGLGVLFSAQGAGNSFGAHWLLADTTGHVAFTNGAAVPTYSGINNRGTYLPKWNANDTFDFKVQRVGQRAYISMTDRATKFTSFLQIPYVYQSVSALTLHFYGGSYDFVGDFNISYQDLQFNKFAVAGNSIAYGGNAFNEATKWPTIAFDGHKGSYVDLSASNEGSLQGTYRVQDIVEHVKPDYIIICYGVNDAHGGVSIDSFTARMTRIITQCIAGGVTPILATITPQGGVNVTPYNTVIETLASTYSLRLLPFYNNMVAAAGTGMYANYDPNDNIHPGQYGHNIEGFTARQGILDLLELESPLNLKQIPVSNYSAFNLGLDANYNVVSVPRGRDTTTINNIGEAPSLINRQPGIINILGRIVGSDGLVISAPDGTGYPSVANGGMLSVNFNSDGYVKAINFNSRGLDVSGGLIVLGSAAHQQVQLPASVGAYMNGGFGSYMEFRARGANSSNENMRLTTDGSATLSTFHHMNFYTNSTLYGYIGAYGDPHTFNNSGYTRAIDWATLGDNDWVTKNLVDSIISAGGGVTLYSGNGTISGDRVVNGGNNELNFINIDGWIVNGTTAEFSMSGAIDLLGTSVNITGTDSVRIHTLGFVPDSTDYKAVYVNRFTGALVYGVADWAGGGGGGGSAWNDITSPTGDQALTFQAGESTTWTNQNTTEDMFTVNTSTLTSSSLFSLNSTSTALAAGNNLMELIMSGANGTNGITAVPLRVAVSNTNATSGTNIGADFTASGATTSNFAIRTGIDVSNGGRVNINNSTESSNHTLLVKSINNTTNVGILVRANNESQNLAIGYNGIRGDGGVAISTSSGDITQSASANSSTNVDNNGQINLAASVGVSVGTANFTPTSRLETNASFGTAIASTSTDITLDATHHTVLVDASGAARTITLPAASGCTRRIYVIKKTDNSANVVTVDPNASELIDGAANQPLATQWKSVMIQSNGTDWFILSSF